MTDPARNRIGTSSPAPANVTALRSSRRPAVREGWQNEWDDWLIGWREALYVARSPQTVVTYLRGVRQFLTWLAEHAPEADAPERVTSRHVEGWLADLARQGRGPATRRVRLMTLRALFGWIVAEPGSPITTDPSAGIRAPEVPLGPVQVVTDDQLRRVLDTCRGGSFAEVRDAAMLRVLISCGLRRAELVALTVTDVDLARGDLLVHGKGGKDRLVSIASSKATLALSRYLRMRRKHPFAATTDRLFLPVRMAGVPSPITGGAVAEMLRRRCRQAGITDVHPHALRHAWADANKRAGLSDENLERLAGWSSPLMVRRYGRALAEERARDAHRDLATGDRI